MGQAISAFVLDGGHGTWPDELKHDDSGAPESHSHTCRKQRGRITPGVEELDAGGSQNVPASGILAWVDGRVGPAMATEPAGTRTRGSGRRG